MRCVLNPYKGQRGVCAVVILVSVLTALLFCGSALASGQEHKDKLSKKELKALIATAKNPEEHLRLAAHYRAEANEYPARQK